MYLEVFLLAGFILLCYKVQLLGGVYVVCVCVHEGVSKHACRCTGQRLTLNALLDLLSFQDGVCCDPGVHWFAWIAWPHASRILLSVSECCGSGASCKGTALKTGAVIG